MTKESMHNRPARARAIGVALAFGMAVTLPALPSKAQDDGLDREDREFVQRIEREARERLPQDALVAIPPIRIPYNEYAVKFVCGRIGQASTLTPVVNGFYGTAVNVHNPGPLSKFSRKVAIARPGEGGEVTGYWTFALKNDQAVEFDCRQIHQQILKAGIRPGPFFKGFLVLHAQRQIDVVAVYTAGPSNGQGVSSIHTERVPARRIP